MSEQPHSQTPQRTNLRFWQQNLNKSSDAQLDLLHYMTPGRADIAILQEPHINFLGNAQASSHWITVYPTGHRDDPSKTRVLTMINRTKISSNAWTQLDVPCQDVVAVQVITSAGTLRIYNIYNDCLHDNSVDALNAHLRRAPSGRGLPRPIRYVWMGDFNRHSPIWDEDRNHHLFTRDNLQAADKLIRMAAEFDMRMVLPQGLATLEAMASGNRTRVDNVFADSGTADMFDLCTTREDWRPVKTDHFPVISHIGLGAEGVNRQRRLDFRLVDWEDFNKVLTEALERIRPPAPIRSAEDADSRLDELENAVWDVIDSHVPLAALCPYSKRWWTPELTTQRKEVSKLARKARDVQGIEGHPDIARHKRARNAFAEALRKAKESHWVTWLEEINKRSIWDAHRLVSAESSDGGAARVPALRVRERGTDRVVEEAIANEDKASMFYKLFFPAKPLVSAVPDMFEYQAPKWTHETVSDEQIEEAIRQLKPKKASKPGSVPNAVLIHAGEQIVPYLGPLFRATDTIKWYPQRWKVTNTPVIKKPGKADYTVPGAWRPVVLSDGFARLLNKCKTNYLVNKCEQHGVLQANHFGGRPGRSTTDSIHLLIKMIKDAWRKGLVASVLFLDVKGAFPSVAIDRMVHELRCAGVPKEHAEWMVRRLDGRQTSLTFDDFRSRPFEIDNGLDQGDPTSGITYMIYNGGLLDCLDHKKGEFGALFIDDAYILVTGASFEDTHRKLKHIMVREDGVFQWATEHNCEFGVDKFQLLDCSRKREADPTAAAKTRPIARPDLILRGQRIASTPAAVFLGVKIDRELRWKAQADKMVAKGQLWAAQIQRIAKVTRGVAPALIRQLYLAVAVPRIFYAADVCLVAATKKGRAGGVGLVARLTTIQRRAAIAITGAMRSTATDVLNVHANLLPVPVLIDHLRARAALRLATLPKSHPLFPHVRKAARRPVKRHRAPLHGLFEAFGIAPDEIETVDHRKARRRKITGIRTKIARTREAAVEMDGEDSAAIQIYTDGSGIGGKVGAAAVLYRNGRKIRSVRYHLGSERDHTVPEAEAVAFILALELLGKEKRVRRASLAADNVGSIWRSTSSDAKPMQHIWEMFHKRWVTLNKRFRTLLLTIRWVPGHEGVPGNEEADRMAKRAAEEGSSNAARLPAVLRKALPRSKAAAARRIAAVLKSRAKDVWKRSPRFRRMKYIDGSLPSARYLELIKGLSRRKASLMIQLRSGHVPLHDHLFKLTQVDSPMCPGCERARETVHHFLMMCPAYTEQRRRMQAGGRGGARMAGKLLSDPKLTGRLMRFIAETGRFRTTNTMGHG
jgi:ribonuclease HI/endonuclease/exonuclease/phosphatase family metal-dependent hydrolase